MDGNAQGPRPEHLLNSKEFMMAWTGGDAPDLTDKVAVVTGANSGLVFSFRHGWS
jgi:hypothetical protein